MLILSYFPLLNDFWANCTCMPALEVYSGARHNLESFTPLIVSSLMPRIISPFLACLFFAAGGLFFLCLCYKRIKTFSHPWCAERKLHSVMVLLPLCLQCCHHPLIRPGVSYFAWPVLASATHRAGLCPELSTEAFATLL